MEALNMERAMELFKHEAVLMGTEDRVPLYRVAELFGEDAVKHIRRMGGGYINGYGVGDYTMMAATVRGFLAAVSFSNVQKLRAMSKGYGME